MTRRIQDADLELWEVYASVGDFGAPERARMVFHSLSGRDRRARVAEREGDRTAVEYEVASLSDAELAGLLERASELN